ncbi:capsanthin/capsorubin synthase, chromoplastic-like [Arachis hypogaea]|uniref:Uncharacterized protein n=1 Tax=Arachis hypogaea TaxID=3818 RepID=A0A445CR30_ARAHY|nr:hypothetical protein Ahy_A06g028383 [Arachis hypogaea]
MDKEIPVSQYDVVTPPPPTKATLFSFLLPKTHYTSSSSCSSTSKRFRVRAYNNTSKLGTFLNLKPAHQPKPLDFDLPWCHPSYRFRFDVIIIGSDPVGTRLAEQVFRYGIKVCCVDPNPLSMWPTNYGVWVDEFESIDLENCLEGVSPMGLNFTRKRYGE